VPTAVPVTGQNLTEREHEVLRLLVKGLYNQQIAERLVITIATVKRHRHSISCKLGTLTRVETIAYVLDHHLVPDD
jgi:NarL family two-component system response regulator LiaR